MNALSTRPVLRIAIGAVAPLLLLLWWQSQADIGGSRSVAFISLASVGDAALELIRSGELLDGAVATLSRAFTGLLFGATFGVLTGVAMAISSKLDRALGSLLHALRQVPMIGWLPLIGLWFGTGQGSEIIVISMAAFFPSMLNSYTGVAHVEKRYHEVGRIYGFTLWQRFRLILLPAAMPLILTGLTQALAFSWIAAIGSEILMGAGSGLGVTLQLAQTQQRLDIIFVAIAVTAALGFTINQLFVRLRRHLLRWQAPAL